MNDYIKRTMEKTVEKMKKSFPVIMITGPRQVGKTTLLSIMADKNKNEKINFISLDDLNARALAIEDPELFLRTYEMPLIIDEFQYAPNLLSYIKMIVDKKRLENLKDNNVKCNGLFYLTGSQAFETMENVTESLAGRIAILDMNGLTNREIENMEDEVFLPDLEVLNKKKTEILSTIQVFDKIIKGSYPEIYKNKEIDRNEYFETYIRTYIERDIRQLINVQDEIKFLKFISNVAVRTGQELNLSDICNGVGITSVTAEKWLSILKNTGIIYLLQPYSNNNVARIVKKPKVYFMDTGLACYLAGYMDSITLEKSAYNGAIFETYVISEIIKSYINNGFDAKKYLYYYRDNNGKEIDLLIIKNNIVYPIEIKKSANPGKEAIKNFSVINKFGLEVGNGGVICMKSEIFPIDKENNYIPIELI